MPPNPSAKTNELYRMGVPQKQIALRLGISLRTVQRYLKEGGTSAGHSPTQQRRNLARTLQDRQHVDHAAWVLAMFGCTPAEYRSFRHIADVMEPVLGHQGGNPIAAYSKLKRRAAVEGVPFELTLPEWWSVWKESKRFMMRHKFDMQPIELAKGYAVNNVRIVSTSQDKKTTLVFAKEGQEPLHWITKSFATAEEADNAAFKLRKTGHFVARGREDKARRVPQKDRAEDRRDGAPEGEEPQGIPRSGSSS